MSVKVEVCAVCGCRLAIGDTHGLCRACFEAEMADIEAEDMDEDSMTDAERKAEFLG